MPLSIAIVGFGRMAQRFYAPALKKLAPDARYAIADPADEARGKAQMMFSRASCFAAVEDLADFELDAALVASPPGSHFHAWRIFSARDLPMFMEKPFPLPQDIAAVEGAAEKVSPLFMINFNRRFWPPYRRLLTEAKSGAIGDIRAASLQLITDPAKWIRGSTGEQLIGSDGALQDLGCHVVDFALALFGSEPSAVVAVPSDVPDFTGLSLTVQWPEGRTVDALVGYGKTMETISVAGSGGTLTMHDPHGRIWRGERAISAAGLGRAVADLATMSTYALRPGRTITRATTLAALGSFLDCLSTGALPRAGLADALQVARVLAAAERSLISKAPASLAAPVKSSRPGLP